MDDKIRSKIVETVHADHGWKTDQVRVDEVERLRRDSCSFYTAGHTVRPLSYQLNYALLKGETVISLSDNKAVSKIVNACGSNAPADWWAEIITRFHQDLGTGVVLKDATQKPAATRKIQAAKKEFAAPALTGNSGNRKVTFYLLHPESFVVYSIDATENPDGTFTVTKTAVR